MAQDPALDLCGVVLPFAGCEIAEHDIEHAEKADGSIETVVSTAVKAEALGKSALELWAASAGLRMNLPPLVWSRVLAIGSHLE